MNLLTKLRINLGRHVRQNPQRLLQSLVGNVLTVESVIHCGAHLAQERHFYEKIGAKRIVWLEGSLAILNQLDGILAKETGEGKLSARHKTVHALLFSESGQEIVLHGFSNQGQSNSIYHSTDTFSKRWPGIAETGEDERHLSTTLDAVSEKHAPLGSDLLVLDLQGAEMAVLDGGLHTLERAKAVICEISKVPIYKGGAQLPDVLARFRSAGFLPLHRTHTTGDLLFVREKLLT